MDFNTIRAAAEFADPIEQVAFLCDRFFEFADQKPDLNRPDVQEIYWDSYLALEAIYARDRLEVIFMGPTGYDVDPGHPHTCYEFIERTFKHTRHQLAPVLTRRELRKRFESKRSEVHALFGAGLPTNELHPSAHSTLRLAHDRACTLLETQDYAGVLQACASMLETHAKIVCADPSFFHKSLGWFLSEYRLRSQLHSELIDYIGQVFNARNRTPMAGHGAPEEPTVDKVTAVMLIEFCVALVRIEHQLVGDNGAQSAKL